MKRKCIVLSIVLLFIVILINPVTVSNELEQYTTQTLYDGTLSGYVNDTSMNPIEGVLVRVYFHGTYEEDYTDSTGYYSVTNIPICWCMKNCTASKVGYKTKWVLLGIYENTKYDFVLSPSEVYPIFNGTVGDNGWFISPVNVSFVYDPEIVVKICCSFVGNYTGPFTIYEQGVFSFCYKWLDIWGNWSFGEAIVKIDYTSPTIEEVEWETYKEDGWWYCRFTCYAVDSTSGMDRVEFLVHHHPSYHNGLHDVIKGSGPFYEFVIQWVFCFCKKVFTFAHYDVAGNSAYDSINESKITSFPINNNHIIFQVLLERFPRLCRLLDALKVNLGS